jgi:iron(III) transport system permease protein
MTSMGGLLQRLLEPACQRGAIRFGGSLAAPVALAVALLVWLVGVVDPRPRGLAINTLILCGSITAVVLPIGLVLAAILARTDLPGRRLLLLLVLLLIFVPLYLQAAAWQAGFGLQGALLPVVATEPWVSGWLGTIWIHAAASLGWVVLIFIVGVRAAERPLEELALLDAPAARVFWNVTAPRAAGAILVAAIWTAISAAGEMTVTNLFQVRTFAEELYTQLALGESLTEVVLTGAWAWFFAIGSAAAGFYAIDRFLAKAMHAQEEPLLFCLGRWRWLTALGTYALVAILVAIPLASLVAKAGLTVTAAPGGERVRTWSIAKAMSLVVSSPMRFGRELSWSLGLASLSATLAFALAVPLAWWARMSHAARLVVLAVAALGLALPGPVVGLAIIELMNDPRLPVLNWLYDHTIVPPLLALVVRGLPVALLVLWFAVFSLPWQLFELAQLDGVSQWAQLRRIVLPLRWPAMTAGWLAAFALAMGDLSTSILVLPPGVETIALRLFERLHYGAEDQVAGVSLALWLGFGLIGAVAVGMLTRQARTTKPRRPAARAAT